MFARDLEPSRGLSALRTEVLAVLALDAAGSWLLSDAGPSGSGWSSTPPDGPGTAEQAEGDRIAALVDLAREGDADAFGLLYDHYQASIYRFVYYRVGSVPLAEDLTSETFFRALRGMASFRWQGKDFGAWLTTIARNLTTDHFKAGRTRLEFATEDLSSHEGSLDDSTGPEDPETTVVTALTNEILLAALTELPHDQQECLVMRFLQGLSIAETATVLGRSEGAVKQLQLRAVRNLARRLPEGLR
jgi:RNA polymerase sigma-70 factor, ECF subfamily